MNITNLAWASIVLKYLNTGQFLSHCWVRDYSTFKFTKSFYLALYETITASRYFDKRSKIITSKQLLTTFEASGIF